ncbi:hypothetical protein NW769_015160 [Fusarium oxysporum]|nr:hypothetical protein NW769_015160 [Fusarium oxysporum]
MTSRQTTPTSGKPPKYLKAGGDMVIDKSRRDDNAGRGRTGGRAARRILPTTPREHRRRRSTTAAQRSGNAKPDSGGGGGECHGSHGVDDARRRRTAGDGVEAAVATGDGTGDTTVPHTTKRRTIAGPVEERQDHPAQEAREG